MKNYRLPETDVALLAFRGREFKPVWLLDWLQPKKITRTYNPYRKTIGDGLNLQLPLLETLIPTPWDSLEGAVRQECGNNDELIKMNLPIARAVHTFSVENQLSAEPIDGRALYLTHGRPYTFWLPVIVRYAGRASVVFTDPRKNHGLGDGGRLFVLSTMHERFRVAFPEYADLHLEVWGFDRSSFRRVRVYDETGLNLIPYERIIEDVKETYEILEELNSEQLAAARRTGGQTRGPLL